MIETLDKKLCKNNLSNSLITTIIKEKILQKKYKSQVKPICIINVGGPASGKTTTSHIYIKDILSYKITDFCIVNPDDILNEFFNNNINCYHIDKNSPYFIINKLFHKAITYKYNILYDTTGLNIDDIKKKLKILKKNKYKIYICISIIDNINIALKRLESRFKKKGRDIDKDYFIKRYIELPDILNNFYFNKNNIKIFNELIIFNTSKDKPKYERIIIDNN